jgi:hypothetical protein
MFFGYGNEHAIEQPYITFSLRSGCVLNKPTYCKILLEATAIACPPHWWYGGAGEVARLGRCSVLEKFL